MKRNQPAKSNPSSDKPLILEPRRLASARGGADLGIAVAHQPLAEDVWTQQHNEALIQL